MPDGTTSPTSFAGAAELLNDNRPFLAEAEAIVAAQSEKRVGGVCWSGLTAPIEEVEDVRRRLASLDAARKAFLATPEGKARVAISRALRICELNNDCDAWAALEPVDAALSRSPRTAAPFVAAAQERLAALPETDAKVALLLLATELLVICRGMA